MLMTCPSLFFSISLNMFVFSKVSNFYMKKFFYKKEIRIRLSLYGKRVFFRPGILDVVRRFKNMNSKRDPEISPDLFSFSAHIFLLRSRE